MDENNETAIVPVARVDIIPAEHWELAGKVADLCKQFVEATAVNISNKKYIPVEGWQSIAAAWGCTPSTEEPQKVEGGYRCKAVLKRDSDGAVLSEAYAFVGEDEIWKDRARYANEAMVQTRAVSRVCRNKFAFVAVLMKIPHLSTTPAEEVPRGGFKDDLKSANSVQEFKIQGMLKSYEQKDKNDPDKVWYKGVVNGKYCWTLKEDLGHSLIEANGCDVILTLEQKLGAKTHRLVNIEYVANLKPEPDDILLSDTPF